MQNILHFGLRFSAIALLLLLSSGFASCAEPETDPVIGRWIWMKGDQVEINADGTFSGLGMKGQWTYLPATSVERHYLFVWEGGKFVDKLTLSDKFDSMKGKNQLGDRVTAKRAIELKK